MNGRMLAFPVTAGLVLLLALQGLRVTHRWEASRIAGAVERASLQATASGSLTPRLVEYNLDRLRGATDLDPTNVHLPILQGSQYMLLGRPRPAIEAYDEAMRLEPRAEIYLNRGKAYRILGDEDAAERDFRTVVELDPFLGNQVRDYLRTRDRRQEVLDRLEALRGGGEARPVMFFFEDFERRNLRRWKRHRNEVPLS